MANFPEKTPVGPINPTNASRPPAQRRQPGQVSQRRDPSARQRKNDNRKPGDKTQVVDEYA
jgi:hypothetical protein